MSQWGNERLFYRGETKIRVMAHVSTPTWLPTAKHHLVDDLFLLDIQGKRETADQMLTQLKISYVGKPHSLWAESMKTEI